MTRAAKLLILVVAASVLIPAVCQAELDNVELLGLQVGDPIAGELAQAHVRITFLDVRAGVWSWSFWHPPVRYDVPFMSVDYGWYRPLDGWLEGWWIRAGVVHFFGDIRERGRV